MNSTKSSKRACANVLRNAAKTIEKYGWIKGTYGSKTSGFCALGAIYHTNPHPNGDSQPAARALHAFLRTEITYFNDYVARSQKEVTGAMRKTARLLEHGMAVPA